MKILFDPTTIGYRFQNLLASGQKIGAHKGSPAIQKNPFVKHWLPFANVFCFLLFNTSEG